MEHDVTLNPPCLWKEGCKMSGSCHTPGKVNFRVLKWIVNKLDLLTFQDALTPWSHSDVVDSLLVAGRNIQFLTYGY